MFDPRREPTTPPVPQRPRVGDTLTQPALFADLESELRAWIAAGYGNRCTVCGDPLPWTVSAPESMRHVCDACRVPATAPGRLS